MKNLENWLPAVNIGLEFAVTVIAGVLLGYFLDTRYATLPWGIITGAIIFSFIAYRNIFLRIKKMQESEKKHG